MTWELAIDIIGWVVACIGVGLFVVSVVLGAVARHETGRRYKAEQERTSALLKQMAGVANYPIASELPDRPIPDEEEQELVIGWRSYGVHDYNGVHDYSGGVHDYRERYVLHGARRSWMERTFRATCECGVAGAVVDRSKSYPAEYGHHCGVYGLKQMHSWDVGPGLLIAACSFYGVVSEHANGYKAENARIERGWLISAVDIAKAKAMHPMDWPTYPYDPLAGEREKAAAIARQYGFPVEVIDSHDFRRQFCPTDTDKRPNPQSFGAMLQQMSAMQAQAVLTNPNPTKLTLKA